MHILIRGTNCMESYVLTGVIFVRRIPEGV